jgi:hypothetical protein
MHFMSSTEATDETSPLFEVARGFVRFDHVVRFIVNANHSAI